MSYFFSYDDYQNATTNNYVGCSGTKHYDFKFSQMNFNNGTVIFLFENKDMRESFISYANLQNIKFVGSEGITDRLCSELFGRTEQDIMSECEQFSEYKYMVICSPIQLSHEYDPIGELEEILKNVK